MVTEKLKHFLDARGIPYRTVTHTEAYTAQEIAESAHVPGKEVAKTVMVVIDGRLAMAVVPASDRVDLQLLKHGTGATDVDLATERDFETRFPDCEMGAMPPFGNLYDMEVFVSPRLAEDEDISFNAGSHTELVKMAYADFAKLVGPVTIRLSSKDRRIGD